MVDQFHIIQTKITTKKESFLYTGNKCRKTYTRKNRAWIRNTFTGNFKITFFHSMAVITTRRDAIERKNI